LLAAEVVALKLLPERQNLRLGLAGEMAVAEELRKLRHEGYHERYKEIEF
jgi:hypothetical protein